MSVKTTERETEMSPLHKSNVKMGPPKLSESTLEIKGWQQLGRGTIQEKQLNQSNNSELGNT